MLLTLARVRSGLRAEAAVPKETHSDLQGSRYGIATTDRSLCDEIKVTLAASQKPSAPASKQDRWGRCASPFCVPDGWLGGQWRGPTPDPELLAPEQVRPWVGARSMRRSASVALVGRTSLIRWRVH